MNLWFTNLFPYIFLILFHLHTPKRQYPPTGINSQTSIDKTEAFDYYCTPNTPFGSVHFTEYPQILTTNPGHWKTFTSTPAQMPPKNPIKLSEVQKSCLLLGPHGTSPNTQTNHLNPPTSDASGQSSQFLGVLYLALTGLIDSALPADRPWAVAGKDLSYLLKLGPIIWWAMPVPALTPPSPAGAPRVTVSSIMPDFVCPSKKAQKAGKSV
ncbi:hypothetical protein DSO57_1033119 [Entomophthora muscae]|uniref:Uncharacterized protein n=1 Tax=Entomophthora muscae TaxID=34485 RepID=A0ACC2SPK6_9FUNG|nr:hypothetical protein DSO57_1033119 [Entomophthora muscae]